MQVPVVVDLANRQLAAYNAGDVEAFCACYAEDVVVLDAEGQVTMRGMEAFRPRYAAMFADHVLVGAEIVARVTRAPHLVEHEIWRRQRAADDALQTGDVLVRYTEREGRIAVVQFMG